MSARREYIHENKICMYQYTHAYARLVGKHRPNCDASALSDIVGKNTLWIITFFGEELGRGKSADIEHRDVIGRRRLVLRVRMSGFSPTRAYGFRPQGEGCGLRP